MHDPNQANNNNRLHHGIRWSTVFLIAVSVIMVAMIITVVVLTY